MYISAVSKYMTDFRMVGFEVLTSAIFIYHG